MFIDGGVSGTTSDGIRFCAHSLQAQPLLTHTFEVANRTRNPKPLILSKRPAKWTHHIFKITIGHMALLNMHEKPARRGHNKVNCRVQSILLCFHPAPSTHQGSSKTSMMAYWLRYMKYLQPEIQLLQFLLPCYPCILSWAPHRFQQYIYTSNLLMTTLFCLQANHMPSETIILTII